MGTKIYTKTIKTLGQGNTIKGRADETLVIHITSGTWGTRGRQDETSKKKHETKVMATMIYN